MSDTLAEPSHDLRHFFVVPRRRWRVVVATALIIGAVSVALLTVWPKTYTATATVSLEAFSTQLFDTSRPVDQLIDIPGEIKIATSAVVADRAAEDLGRPEDAAAIRDSIEASGAPGDTTLTLAATATSADDAVETANAVAAAYLDHRQEAATERRDVALSLVRDTVGGLRAQLVNVNRRLSEASPGSRQAAEATSDRTVLVGQLSDLTTRQNAIATTVLAPGEVVGPATSERVEESPRPALVIGSGVLLGLVVGLLLAFVRDRSDTRLRDAEHLGEVTRAPVLGAIAPSAYGAQLAAADAAQLRLVRARLLAALGDTPFSLLVLDLGRRPTLNRLGGHLAALVAATGRPVTLLRAGAAPPSTRAEDAAVFGRTTADGETALQIRELASDAGVTSLDDALQDPEVARLVGSLQERGRSVVVVPASRLDRARAIALCQAVQAVLLVAERRATRHEEIAAFCSDARDAGAVMVGVVLCESSRWRPGRSAGEQQQARPSALAPARDNA